DSGNAIKQIIKDFSDAGYSIKYQLFNTADYGVPQTRYRVIIIGVRTDLNFEYTFPLPTHINPKKKNSSNLNLWISISDALKNIIEPEDNHTLKNHVYSQYKVTNRNFTGHRATDPDKPSPTILARGNGKGGV